MATYNTSKVITYAQKWCNGNNPDYVYWGKNAGGVQSPNGGNGDCANFASQCLYEGGLRFKTTGSAYRQWYYYTKGGSYTSKSSSWSGANDLRMFVRDTQDAPRLVTTEVSWYNRTSLQVGDLVFLLKSESSTESGKRNIEASHVAICAGFDANLNLMVWEHSPYGMNKWSTYDSTGKKTALYHIESILDSTGGSSTFPSDVDPFFVRTGTINTTKDPLNIRADTNTNAAIVGKAAKGSTVSCYATTKSSSWWYVVQGNLRGYGSKQYILTN